MNKDIVLNKIENIKNCLERIEGKKPFDLVVLQTNFDLQDIISINVQRAIHASTDLAIHICSELNLGTPKDMADSFNLLGRGNFITPELASHLAKAVALRNVLIHEYDGVNWSVVLDVCENRLLVFRDFCSQIFKLC